MRGRLDLFGRLLLILVGSVLMLGAAAIAITLLRDGLGHAPGPTFPRVRQAAGIIDLMANARASDRGDILRAANGVDLTAKLLPVVPHDPALRIAPKLGMQLRRFMRSATPVAAFTNIHAMPRHTNGKVEGYLSRATARLPDGQMLVLSTNITPPDTERPRLFGLPASLWSAALAVMVVALALWLTARETRPLRDLVRATRRFDGTMVTASSARTGAADIRRTAAAVAEMQSRVIELLAERSLVIGAISHDLRTLLTRMRLRTTSITTDALRSRMEADLDGMDAMLSDALAFARGTAASVHVSLDLADVVAAEVAERQVRDGMSIETDLADTPCKGDLHALRRVVANLLDNAQKYGRGQILVTVSSVEGAARLSIEDDGPGIPPDQREAVLTPYHRGDDPRLARSAGSGLGLAIVQQIIKAHRGSVDISRSRWGGAKICVTIPQPT